MHVCTYVYTDREHREGEALYKVDCPALNLWPDVLTSATLGRSKRAYVRTRVQRSQRSPTFVPKTCCKPAPEKSRSIFDRSRDEIFQGRRVDIWKKKYFFFFYCSINESFFFFSPEKSRSIFDRSRGEIFQGRRVEKKNIFSFSIARSMNLFFFFARPVYLP